MVYKWNVKFGIYDINYDDDELSINQSPLYMNKNITIIYEQKYNMMILWYDMWDIISMVVFKNKILY